MNATKELKKRVLRIWSIRIATLIGVTLLFFYGYCFGLWGRGSLLLQYLFQCSCPLASEEARYPDEVDVIVSACRFGSALISPSGRLLYVLEKENESTSTYLLDLQSQEKSPFFIPEGSHYFLTDNLMFQRVYCGKGYECGYFILDIKTGRQFPIRSFVNLRPDAYNHTEVDLGILTSYLQEDNDIFLIDNDIIVTLTSDFRSSPNQNFYIVQSAFSGYDSDRIEWFLKNNNIDYSFVSDRFPGEALSPDGKFIARRDGIYLATTNQKIVEEHSSSRYNQYWRGYFSVRDWTYDSTGVIYSTFLQPCLFEKFSLGVDETGCYQSVPQPLIKLKVPEEYLSNVDSP
jgi:hypothetical protein